MDPVSKPSLRRRLEKLEERIRSIAVERPRPPVELFPDGILKLSSLEEKTACRALLLAIKSEADRRLNERQSGSEGAPASNDAPREQVDLELLKRRLRRFVEVLQARKDAPYAATLRGILRENYRLGDPAKLPGKDPKYVPSEIRAMVADLEAAGVDLRVEFSRFTERNET